MDWGQGEHVANVAKRLFFPESDRMVVGLAIQISYNFSNRDNIDGSP